MKKLVFVSAIGMFILPSCKKCSECHYDGPSGEVEMGEFCDDELEDLESAGTTSVGDSTYVVHCGEEH